MPAGCWREHHLRVAQRGLHRIRQLLVLEPLERRAHEHLLNDPDLAADLDQTARKQSQQRQRGGHARRVSEARLGQSGRSRPGSRQPKVRVGRNEPADPMLAALPPYPQASVGGDRRRRPSVDGADDLAAVDALEVDAGDAQIGVSELPLDDYERHALVGHLHGVSVAELVWRESSADTGCCGGVVQLFAGGRGFPASPGGRPVDHAEHGADRELAADLEPWLDLFPGPAVHSYLASLAALTTSDEYGAAVSVKVALLKGECLADP